MAENKLTSRSSGHSASVSKRPALASLGAAYIQLEVYSGSTLYSVSASLLLSIASS